MHHLSEHGERAGGRAGAKNEVKGNSAALPERMVWNRNDGQITKVKIINRVSFASLYGARWTGHRGGKQQASSGTCRRSTAGQSRAFGRLVCGLQSERTSLSIRIKIRKPVHSREVRHFARERVLSQNDFRQNLVNHHILEGNRNSK